MLQGISQKWVILFYAIELDIGLHFKTSKIDCLTCVTTNHYKIRHQVIRTACERWDKACKEEDDLVRPIHRPREWKQRERRLEKERKTLNWHQSKKNQISAPPHFRSHFW